MSEAVKTSRSYDSSGRRERARRNRDDILANARTLFLELGYAGTTMSAVAERGGVSVETIYKSIGNKPEVLKAVLDAAIVGDYEPVPMLERTLVARMRAEPDPRKLLALYGEHVVESWPRQVPVQLIARTAASAEPTAHDLWQAIQTERLLGMGVFAQDLADRGFLRPELTVEEARDVLWTLTSPEQYEILVLQRGWPMERVARFVVDAMAGTLLPPQ